MKNGPIARRPYHQRLGQRRRRRILGRLLLFVLVLAALAAVAAPWWLRHREANPVLRGSRLAAENGCLGCHLLPRNREIPNPGSEWGSVPRFGAGTASLYLDSPAEIEEFILQGAPSSWLADRKRVERLEAQLIRMPAYGERLSEREVADLAAWVRAIEGIGLPGKAPVSDTTEGAAAGSVALGRNLAWKHGCVACHGPEGSGGIENPGALGGFVPGFAGANFPDLVRGEEEFREWVLTGTSKRLSAIPLVPWFWKRQRLQMPAYEGRLTDEEIGQLWEWVGAVRGEGAGNAG